MRIASYLKTRAVDGPWQIEGCTGNGLAGAVVIPALAESATAIGAFREKVGRLWFTYCLYP